MAEPWQEYATPPAAGPWNAFAQGQGDEPPREGGLAQTIPAAAGMATTPEGRGRLLEGIEQEFPVLHDVAAAKTTAGRLGAVASHVIGMFTGIAKSTFEAKTPEEEAVTGLNAAMLTMGGGTEFAAGHPVVKAVAPVVKAFDDGVIAPAATRLDSYARIGDPNGVRLEPPLPETRGSPIQPIADSPFAGVPRSILAKTGVPEVDAILAHPPTRAVIDNPIVDRSRTIPYEAGGSVPLNRATTYLDEHVPETFTAQRLSDPSKTVTFDPAEPTVIHENSEETAMDILIKAGMKPDAAYRVSHFEIAEVAEHAWYRANDIDPASAEAEWKKLQPGIQHEIASNVPSDLYHKEYPSADVAKARHEDVFEAPPTPEEKAQAFEILRNAPELQPKSAAPMLQEARELGVIGEQYPRSLNQLPPKEAGQRAMAANGPPPDKVTGEVGGAPEQTAWRKRWERTLDKMQTPADARAVISSIVDANDEFAQARQGNMSAGDVEKYASVTGLDSTKIDAGEIGQKIKTNAEMRNTIEAFRSVNEKIAEAAQKLTEKGGLDDEAEIAELTQRELQRDLLLQSTGTTKALVALRAEFGRAGNVLQEFQKALAETNGMRDFLKDQRGHTTDDVRDRARLIAATPAEALPKVMESLRNQPVHWFYWAWVQGLISGLVTHTKYVAANALYAGTERGIVTPLASILGTIRGGSDRVFIGETAAMHFGTIAAVPDAVKAAYQTIKSGVRVPLESEVELHALETERYEKDLAAYKEAKARGEDVEAPPKVPKALERAVNPLTQTSTVNRGVWDRIPSEAFKRAAGRFFGLPGDMASAIHMTFKVLGERANLEAWAYNKAAGEGLNPTSAEFWERRAYHSDNPSQEVLRDTVHQAYKDTFMQELGEHAKAFQAWAKQNPVAKWLVPFAHIPINLMKATYEYTPFAFLDKDMRANLTGANGGRAQDLAISRMTVGSAVLGYFAHKYMTGQATGDYPTDPKEREEWKLMGKQPNSIMIGDQWVSYDRFGPAGDLARIGANTGSLVHHYDPAADDNLTKLTWMGANAAANTIADEVGFQSLRNFMDAVQDEHKGVRWAAYQAGSFMPYSSLVTQTASYFDPQMRDTKSFMDGLRYRIPGLRDNLMPKRDPLYGEPLPNPGFHNFIRSTPVINDPAKTELDRLGHFPTAPQQVIGHVKLTPEQYDRYEATAGPLVKQMLSAAVQSPRYQTMPDVGREALLKGIISAGRARARAAMQMAYPQLIQQGIDARKAQITGQ